MQQHVQDLQEFASKQAAEQARVTAMAQMRELMDTWLPLLMERDVQALKRDEQLCAGNAQRQATLRILAAKQLRASFLATQFKRKMAELRSHYAVRNRRLSRRPSPCRSRRSRDRDVNVC